MTVKCIVLKFHLLCVASMYKYNSFFFCIELKFCNLAKRSKLGHLEGLCYVFFLFSETIVLCYLSKKSIVLYICLFCLIVFQVED